MVSTSGSSGIDAGQSMSERAHRMRRSPARGAARWTRSLSATRRSRPQEKTRRVGGVFSSVARRYDLMNDLMSGGHAPAVEGPVRAPGAAARRRGDPRHGRRHRRRRLPPRRAAAPRSPSPTSTRTCSTSAASGPRSAASTGWSGREENAEALSFADRSFDAYTIAFGIRNVTHIDRGAGRGAPGAEDRRPLLLPRILDDPLAGLRDALRRLFDARRCRGSARRWRGDEESYRYLVEFDPRAFPTWTRSRR